MWIMYLRYCTYSTGIYVLYVRCYACCIIRLQDIGGLPSLLYLPCRDCRTVSFVLIYILVFLLYRLSWYWRGVSSVLSLRGVSSALRLPWCISHFVYRNSVHTVPPAFSVFMSNDNCIFRVICTKMYGLYHQSLIGNYASTTAQS
jgi:hypothetical protein